jgi:hypothetical protein
VLGRLSVDLAVGDAHDLGKKKEDERSEGEWRMEEMLKVHKHMIYRLAETKGRRYIHFTLLLSCGQVRASSSSSAAKGSSDRGAVSSCGHVARRGVV